MARQAAQGRRANARDALLRPKRRADWDNFHKLSCDALSGIVYEDDSQIRQTVALAYDEHNPRMEIAVEPL